MRSRTRGLIAGVVCLGALVAVPAAAQANHHLVKIREVHYGSAGNDSYAMLQMYADGENFLMGHYVSFRSADGQLQGDHLINVNAAIGTSQRTFLVGNSGVPGSDDVGTMDQIVGPNGAVCYEEANGGIGGIDCVSWGAFTGNVKPLSSLAGNPAPALAPGQSLVRQISGGTCPTALDEADDTNNSAVDFAIAPPIGRNNAAVPTEKLCTTAVHKKKCKKKKKHHKSAYSAKKKKCKKHKKKH